MSASLRQRRRPDDDDHPPTADEEEKRFAEHYRRQIAARSRAGPKTLGRALLLLVAIVVAIASILQWRSRIADAPSSNRKDLVLLSVYPRAVARFVHEIEGSPELLVTDDNKPAVEAVRAAIGLANTLRYDGSHKRRRRRKRGVAGALLGISNAISSLVSGQEKREGYVPGEIVLVTHGEAKMRGYLLEHGERCSNPPDRSTDAAANAALRQFDGIVTEMNAAAANDMRQDTLWSRALRLFVSCQFANGHARGYVAHSLRSAVVDSRLREQLERARTTGSGLIVTARGGDSKEEEGDDGTHWSPLMVLPEDAAAEDASVEVSNSLLLGINHERLQTWNEGGTAIGRLDLLDGQARLAPDG